MLDSKTKQLGCTYREVSRKVTYKVTGKVSSDLHSLVDDTWMIDVLRGDLDGFPLGYLGMYKHIPSTPK